MPVVRNRPYIYIHLSRYPVCKQPIRQKPRHHNLPIITFPAVGAAALGLSWRYGASAGLAPAWLGEAMDKDLYDLPPEEADNIPQVAFSLEQALDALEADNAFLKQGDVFSDDLLKGYIELKRQEVEKMRLQVHPLEFELYYSC